MNDDLLLMIFDQLFDRNEKFPNLSMDVKWIYRCQFVSRQWHEFIKNYASMNKQLAFVAGLQEAIFRMKQLPQLLIHS